MNILSLLLIFGLLFLSNSQHCVSDAKEQDKTGLLWPAPSFVPPWVLYPASRIYGSVCLDSFLQNMFQSPLNELTNITIQQILDTYIANKCPFYLHGGLLRDVLEGDPSHDIDIAFPCDPNLALSICKGLLGATELEQNVSLCYTNEVGYLFIGRRKIDTGIEGKYWEDSFFHLENQEYTPNMLYYDMMNGVIIDLNTGVEDIELHQIRIPVKPQLRDLWLFSANTSIGLPETPLFQKWLVLKKVCRYWKLKAKGYRDSAEGDKAYLVGKVNDLWDSPNYPIKFAFLMFLCESLGGHFGNFTCYVPGGYKSISDDKILFCRKYMHELYLDIQGLQDGRIFNEINEIVAYTKCHNYHNTIIPKQSANFIGKLEGMSINMILMVLVAVWSFYAEWI